MNINGVEMQSILIKYIDNNLEYISKPFAREFKKRYNLFPNQLSSLWYLRNYGDMSMGEYAAKMQMSKQQATKLIETLVEKELVERVYSKTNRRTIFVHITQKSLSILKEVEADYTQVFIEKINVLDKKSCQELLQAMQIINDILYKTNLKGE